MQISIAYLMIIRNYFILIIWIIDNYLIIIWFLLFELHIHRNYLIQHVIIWFISTNLNFFDNNNFLNQIINPDVFK